jgi:hypothetical protein
VSSFIIIYRQVTGAVEASKLAKEYISEDFITDYERIGTGV